MKRRVFLMVLSCLLLIISAAGFGQVRNPAPIPQPSRPGGYYDASFTLTLSAPKNGTVYYTTDGSTPTRESQVYHGGIEIYDRSSEPNVYNAVQNVVRDWQDFTPDPDPVPKGTVVRAFFVSDRGFESGVLTQTYFVGIQPPDRGYTLSLVFQPEDLFGEQGIYVTGTEYDQWYLSDGDGPTPVLNFERHSEVRAVAQWLDASGEYLNQPVGLRIQGGGSRYAAKKRFTIVSRKDSSGSNLFDQPLFDDIYSHSVMLKSEFPDHFIGELLSDRAAATQRSTPVQVFLNGEYWYSTYMLERYDEQYFLQHFGLPSTVRIKDSILDDKSAVFLSENIFYSLSYTINSTDFSDPLNFLRLQEKIDVQSFIDFTAANIFFCNIDFGDSHNCVMWRSPNNGIREYEDMRWRWCIYDVDALSWMQSREPYSGHIPQINIFTHSYIPELNSMSLFHALRPNPEFRRQFVLSFMDMMNNNFAPANVEPILKRHGYDLSWMDSFFLERPKYAAQHLAEEFDLTGSLETVTVSANDPSMGSVTVNTSRIDLENGPWSGRYFTDYPITVTAAAKPGYRFVGWKGDAQQAASSLTLSVEGSPVLEAVFAEK